MKILLRNEASCHVNLSSSLNKNLTLKIILFWEHTNCVLQSGFFWKKLCHNLIWIICLNQKEKKYISIDSVDAITISFLIKLIENEN